MEEAKHRLSAMDTALDGETGLPDGAVHEFCFLQLRMLCELIALGCLAAHGDFAIIRKLRKTYIPGTIIKHLEELHSEFYPRAASQTMGGPDQYDAVLGRDGAFTKQELVKLYGKCGDVLHRGGRALSLSNKLTPDFDGIKVWKKKIEVLLAYHVIFMGDNKTIVLFTLRNKANNDQVQVAVCEADGAMDILL